MSKEEERRQSYGGRKPDDYLPAHNHVTHADCTGHGERGFRRFWIPPEWVGKKGGWSKCPCGWHPPRSQAKWETHYAVTEHVQHWKARIKKHGSLEAAYRNIYKHLARVGAI
jgi:hypothetical protein